MPNVGDVIGRFTLDRELGRGPLSEVFLAVERSSGWKAAFKIFLLEPGSKPNDHALFAERMVREATAAARFLHENTVRVHEVGQLGAFPYLVSDYIEGRPSRISSTIARTAPSPGSCTGFESLLERSPISTGRGSFTAT